MKTRRFLTLGGNAVAFALFAVAGAASAQQAVPSGDSSDTGASFQSLDKNQDGHLSRSEIPADMSLLRTRMSTYDTNEDGALDAREFATAQAALHSGGHAGGGGSAPPPPHHSGG